MMIYRGSSLSGVVTTVLFFNQKNYLLDTLRLLGIKVLLEGDAELLTKGLELSKVLLVLALVLNLGLDAYSNVSGLFHIRLLMCISRMEKEGPKEGLIRVNLVPSKTRTAVGKSLTLLAALRAAARTEGEGTRS